MYTCVDQLKAQILEDGADDWNIAFDWQTEVEGLSVVGRDGP